MKFLPRFLIQRLSPLYCRFAEGISEICVEDGEWYFDALGKFMNGESRLIIPFRHVAKADAPVLSAVFGNRMHRLRRGKSLDYWISFLFGDMVLDWAPGPAAWLFPQIGAQPVSNQRMVRSQIDSIRSILLEGKLPLCFAPEAQVNYYNHKPGSLTGGLGHFIGWIQQKKQNLILLPIRIHYEYRKPGKIVSLCLAELSMQFGQSLETLDQAVKGMLSFLAEYLGVTDREGLVPVQDSDARYLLGAIHESLLESGRQMGELDGDRELLHKLLLFRDRVFTSMHRQKITVKDISRAIARDWMQPSKLSELQRLYQHQQLLDVLINFEPFYHHGPETHRVPPPGSIQSSGSSISGQNQNQDQNQNNNREAEQSLVLLDLLNRLKGGDIDSRYFPRGTRARAIFSPPRVFHPGDDPEDWREHFLSAR